MILSGWLVSRLGWYVRTLFFSTQFAKTGDSMILEPSSLVFSPEIQLPLDLILLLLILWTSEAKDSLRMSKSVLLTNPNPNLQLPSHNAFRWWGILDGSC
jgi:hypothetical protein